MYRKQTEPQVSKRKPSHCQANPNVTDKTVLLASALEALRSPRSPRGSDSDALSKEPSSSYRRPNRHQRATGPS